MVDYNFCRHQIPFTCIACPIRQVEMSCCLNNDFGDWKLGDQRKKKPQQYKSKKPLNRGKLMEICRKSACNPEILKYILIARGYSAERCICKHTDPFPKRSEYPAIPFADFHKRKELDQYGYPHDHWFPQYLLRHLLKNPGDDKKPKIFEKITRDWLEKFYDLYNGIVAPRPEDELERYLQELLQRTLEEELRKAEEEDDENYDIEREGRFEQEQTDVDNGEDEDNKDRGRRQRYSDVYKKKKKQSIARKSDDNEKRKHLHNPVDIFYYDPLKEAERKALLAQSPRSRNLPTQFLPSQASQYLTSRFLPFQASQASQYRSSQFLPRMSQSQFLPSRMSHSRYSQAQFFPTQFRQPIFPPYGYQSSQLLPQQRSMFGPTKYTPPPEDMDAFDTKKKPRTPVKFTPTNLSRLGRMPNLRDETRSISSFFQGGYQNLNPRQLSMVPPIGTNNMQGRQSVGRLSDPVKKYKARSANKRRSRNSGIASRRSIFHTYGYT